MPALVLKVVVGMNSGMVTCPRRARWRAASAARRSRAAAAGRRAGWRAAR